MSDPITINGRRWFPARVALEGEDLKHLSRHRCDCHLPLRAAVAMLRVESEDPAKSEWDAGFFICAETYDAIREDVDR